MKYVALIPALLVFLAGCVRETVVVPPAALPALGDSGVVVYQRLSDGRPVVERGPIRWVGVSVRPATARDEDTVEWFRAPFSARVSAEQIRVTDEARAAEIPLRDVQRIEVLYEARTGGPGKGMMIGGIILTSLGGAALVAGVGLMGAIANHGNPDALLVGGLPLVATSVTLAGPGIPLWIVGARRSGMDGPPAPLGFPTVVPAKNGATLRWRF